MELYWNLIKANAGALIGGLLGLIGGIATSGMMGGSLTIGGSLLVAGVALLGAAGGFFTGNAIHNAVRPEVPVSGAKVTHQNMGNGVVETIVLKPEQFLDKMLPAHKEQKNSIMTIMNNLTDANAATKDIIKSLLKDNPDLKLHVRGKRDGDVLTVAEIEIDKEGFEKALTDPKVKTLLGMMQFPPGTTLETFMPAKNQLTGKYLYTIPAPVKVKLGKDNVPLLDDPENINAISDMFRQVRREAYPTPVQTEGEYSNREKYTYYLFNWDNFSQSNYADRALFYRLKPCIEGIAQKDGVEGIVKILVSHADHNLLTSGISETKRIELIKLLTEHLTERINDPGFTQVNTQGPRVPINNKPGSQKVSPLDHYLWYADVAKARSSKLIGEMASQIDYIHNILEDLHEPISHGLKNHKPLSPHTLLEPKKEQVQPTAIVSAPVIALEKPVPKKDPKLLAAAEQYRDANYIPTPAEKAVTVPASLPTVNTEQRIV